MKKYFCISFVLLVFSAFFTLGNASGEACSTCHDLEFSDSLKSKTILGSDFMGLDASHFEIPHKQYQKEQTNILAGKTSGFIEPFHTATLSDKPILYEPSEYVEEPGNPLTDEEDIFKGTMHRFFKQE